LRYVAFSFDIYPKEKSMQKRKFPAIWAALALAIAGVSPAIAAPTNNANIQVGTSTTSGIPNIKVDVSTASASVSLTIKIAGTQAAPGGTTAGSYNITGGAKIVRSPGANSAGVFFRDPNNSANMNAVTLDTGITSVGGGSFTGTFNAGNVTTNPITYTQNSLGGGNGDVVACLPLNYYYASNSYETIWYCTETFAWPEAPDTTAPSLITFGANAPAIQSDGVTLRIRFSEGMSAANAPTGFVLKRNGVNVSMTAGNLSLAGTTLDFTLGSTVNSNDGGTFTLFYTQGSVADDAATPNLLANFSGVSVTNGSTQGFSGGSSSRPAPAKYEGPEILALDDPRPMVAGGKLIFTGKNLSAVTSATIGSAAATLSYDAATGLTVATPATLAPGKYDLVMKSSYGTLTHLNAVTIKAPTPTVTTGFRSDAQHLSEKQVLDLVAFNKTLSADYEKVRCIVNAADEKTAKRIADLVCAQVARGEARNVEVIKDIRTSYSGEGFWVRVYAKG
jgi:hypothetical protein